MWHMQQVKGTSKQIAESKDFFSFFTHDSYAMHHHICKLWLITSTLYELKTREKTKILHIA